MRRESCHVFLLCGFIALGACSNGAYHENPASRLTYQCNGADNMISYSACDRPDHSDRNEMQHDKPGREGPEPPVGGGAGQGNR
jgi:hypothetical protein